MGAGGRPPREVGGAPRYPRWEPPSEGSTAIVKFVHSGDWHLGMTRHFLGSDAQARYAQARLDAVREMARLAHETGCAFVAVCGDVFDSNHLDRGVVVRMLETLRSFDVPVLLLPGNHDPLNAASVYRSQEFLASKPEHVIVLETSEPVMLADGAVEVVGVPLESKAPVDDIVGRACGELAPREPGSPPRVVVAHGVVDALDPDRDAVGTIRLAGVEQALAANLADYIALGDRHSTTAVGTTGRVWYAGTPLVTDYRDSDPNNVLVVELAAAGALPVVTPHRVGTWTFLRRAFDVNGRSEVDAVAAWLDGVPDKHTAVAKLSFKGTLSLIEKARLDDVLAHHASLFAALETWERHTDLKIRRDDADLDELGLRGFAAATLEELQQLAETGGPQSEVAEDALNLLFRLAH